MLSVVGNYVKLKKKATRRNIKVLIKIVLLGRSERLDHRKDTMKTFHNNKSKLALVDEMV